MRSCNFQCTNNCTCKPL